jgi:hypothetical protein
VHVAKLGVRKVGAGAPGIEQPTIVILELTGTMNPLFLEEVGHNVLASKGMVKIR